MFWKKAAKPSLMDSLEVIDAADDAQIERIDKRLDFLEMNQDRLRELCVRAEAKEKETGEQFAVICIDMDDPSWQFLGNHLMPNEDWDAFRKKGAKPVARGVVPRAALVETIEIACPDMKGKLPEGVFVGVLAQGGVLIASLK